MRPVHDTFLRLALLTAASFALDACCVSAIPVSNTDAGREPDSGMPDAGLDGGLDAGPGDVGRVERSTSGSALAVSRDDKVAVVISRNTGYPGPSEVSVEKYRLDRTLSPPTLTPNGAILLRNAQQVVLSPDDNTAYSAGIDIGSAQSNTGVAVKMTAGANQQLVVSQQRPSGAEPRGLALSPSGGLLYVANWGDGTVSVFDTSDMTSRGTVNLNGALASSGMLGDRAVNLTRNGLAHPWGVAVTDDGDASDLNETIYVTEYFSQARLANDVPTDDSAFELGRQGVIYRFAARDRALSAVITIAPRPVSGASFVDSNDRTTGCFPNLLQTLRLHRNRLYILGTCASPLGPTGPLNDPVTGLPSNVQNFKTLVHPAIFVVNTDTNLEEPTEGLILTREFQRLYDSSGTPDDGSRRMPLMPSDLVFLPGTDTAYVTAYGADAVFRIDFNPDGSLSRVGSPQYRFINLTGNLPSGVSPGELPYGIFMSAKRDLAYVVNEHSRSITTIDMPEERVSGSAQLRLANPSGHEADINDGRRFFVTGLGRWSYKGQAWSSCEACHPSGLSDGVTWFFDRGPRQTISLAGSFRGGNQRVFGWTANLDEVHDFELFTRNLSGGVGAIVHTPDTEGREPALADRISFDGAAPTPAGQEVTSTPQDGLNGTTTGMMPGGAVQPNSEVDYWNKVQTYIQSIRPPTALTIAQADAQAGRAVFLQNNCSGCHGGDRWTLSTRFYVPSPILNDPTTGTLVTRDYVAPARFPAALNPPTAGMSRTAKLRTFDPVNDQINCVLRAVGTFPANPNSTKDGVTASTDVRVREVRQDMTTLAQGATGYNIPSLLGLSVGAPYFHGGNARTLEEVFSTTFQPHANAIHVADSPDFPGTGDRSTLVAQLVAYLLSIDEYTQQVPVPTEQALGYGVSLCPAAL